MVHIPMFMHIMYVYIYIYMYTYLCVPLCINITRLKPQKLGQLTTRPGTGGERSSTRGAALVLMAPTSSSKAYPLEDIVFRVLGFNS